MRLIFIIFSFFLFVNSTYSLDDGTSQVEYSFGEVILLNNSNIDNEYFLYLSHNYLYYNGNFYFSFKSQLGISKNLIFQDSAGLSYKNLLTGVIPGIKYKYLDGIYGFIPEVFTGITLDIISLWEDNNDNNLIFFTGINLGLGIAYGISKSFKLGLKIMYDIGYGNFMNKRKDRFVSSIITFMLSFDFYED